LTYNQPTFTAAEDVAEAGDPIERARHVWKENHGSKPDYFAAMTATLRLEQLVGAELDRLLRTYRLNRTGYLILVELLLCQDNAALTMGQLGKRLSLHPTTVSLVTDKLQARRLVRRSPHPTDRRALLASLTEEGARVLSTVSESLGAANYGLEGVTNQMAITLTEVIRLVCQSIGEA
jgi:DNA-binding MarR family transcriptional regulator